jgi:hypothetical protein
MTEVENLKNVSPAQIKGISDEANSVYGRLFSAAAFARAAKSQLNHAEELEEHQ